MAYIRLETDRGELDLKPTTQMEWLTINPFFEEDEDFVPQLTLPFSLPMTDKNRYVLSYAEQLQVSNYKQSLRVRVYLGGILFFRGRLNILNPGSDGYEVSVGYDRSVIDTSRSIRSFEYGGARAVTAAADRASYNNKGYPEVDMVWPQWYNSAAEENKGYNGGYILVNDYSFPGYIDKEIAIPTPFLIYVLKQVFKEMGGMDARGSLMDSEDFKKKVIYNPVVANTMVNESLQLYMEYDQNDHGNNVVGRKLKIGITDASSMVVVAGGALFFELMEYPAGAYQPTVYYAGMYTIQLADVGNSAMLLQNLWTYIQTLSGTLVQLSNDYTAVDEPFFVIQEAMHFATQPGYAPVINNGNLSRRYMNYSPSGTLTYNDVLIAKHLPDITVAELVDAVRNGFNCTTFLSTARNEIVFTPRNETINTAKYKDYTDKLVKGYLKPIIRPRKIKFVFENDTNDGVTDENIYPWYPGTFEAAPYYSDYSSKTAVEFKIGLGHVHRNDTPMVNGRSTGTHYMCEVKQGLGKYSDTEIPKFTLRLMHWWGIQLDSMGVSLPYADDNFLTPDQMYRLHFDSWYRVTRLGREVVEFGMMLTLLDIMALDSALQWKVLHNKYIWKEIRTPVTMDGIGQSRVKLMRVPANANVHNSTVVGDEETIGDG